MSGGLPTSTVGQRPYRTLHPPVDTIHYLLSAVLDDTHMNGPAGSRCCETQDEPLERSMKRRADHCTLNIGCGMYGTGKP